MSIVMYSCVKREFTQCFKPDDDLSGSFTLAKGRFLTGKQISAAI